MNTENTYTSSVIHDPEFDWGTDNYTLPSHFNLVIYEMQVPTFNPSSSNGVGTFQQVLQKLDYLQQLGVNVIEPIPVTTYPGDPRGWGYDPGAPFTIMNAFGGMTGLCRSGCLVSNWIG
jgi:1,4-alpha-glucan branching enzyme